MSSRCAEESISPKLAAKPAYGGFPCLEPMPALSINNVLAPPSEADMAARSAAGLPPMTTTSQDSMCSRRNNNVMNVTDEVSLLVHTILQNLMPIL